MFAGLIALALILPRVDPTRDGLFIVAYVVLFGLQAAMRASRSQRLRGGSRATQAAVAGGSFGALAVVGMVFLAVSSTLASPLGQAPSDTIFDRIHLPTEGLGVLLLGAVLVGLVLLRYRSFKRFDAREAAERAAELAAAATPPDD
jgi:hypothetical protein